MTETTNVLEDTVGQVLEQQAFMFAEPCSCEELEVEAGDFLRASIRFEGPVDGCVDLVIPAALGVELAANVLGIEPEDEEAEALAQDALKEMLNVICGQVLTGLYGTGQVFQLSIPTARPIDGDPQEELGQSGECIAFLIDDEHPVVVRLRLEENGS